MMIYTSFYNKNVISDAQTLEMIYTNTFPWLWKRQNVYNKHATYIQSTYLIFIVPRIVIFYGITNRCHNVQ